MLRNAFGRLLRDEDGSIIVYATLAIAALIGIAGLGSEGAAWLYRHRVIQSAADNAAVSAAAAFAVNSSADINAQARAITANDYNLVHGQDGVTVVATRPPSNNCLSGTSNFTGSNAIEVIVTQPQTPLLSKLFLSNNTPSICSRAVALVPGNGDCLLAVGTSGTGIGVTKNNLNLNLTNCNIFSNSNDPCAISVSGNNDVIHSNAIGAVGGICLNGNSKTTLFNPSSGNPPVPDPYASEAAAWPQSPSTWPPPTCAGCAAPSNPPKCQKAAGHNPGVTAVTLTPGIYADLSSIIGNVGTSTPCTITMNAGSYQFTNGLNITGANITVNVGAGSTIIVPTTAAAGFSNSGTINFGSGNNSIYIGAYGWANFGTINFTDGSNNSILIAAGGWADSGTVNFKSGNFSMAVTGDWTSSSNLTMGTGNYSVSVTGDAARGSLGSFSINGPTSTLGAGLYYVSGNVNIQGNGGQTVTANNVTLVLNGATSAINYTSNNAALTLTAPTTGWNAGIAVWEPSSIGTNLIASGNSSVAAITGVIYAPRANVDFEGNTGSTPVCMQIVSNSMTLNGNSINIQGDCGSVPGMKHPGAIATLVE
jgi:hypothetical protein